MKRIIIGCFFASSCVACSDDGDENGDVEESGPGFGQEADLTMAEDLWNEIDGFTSWSRQGTTSGFVASGAPHGAFVRVFQNDVADGDPEGLPDGSILVKENFMDDSEDTLAAITVMKRVSGLDSETEDWFYAKYLPDGSLDENQDGVQLAGLVGKGSSGGCIPCHSSAEGGDYVFGN